MIVFERTFEDFRIVVADARVNEVVDAPPALGGAFKCCILLGETLDEEWCRKQARKLLSEGAKLFFYVGKEASRACFITEQLVVNTSLSDVAVESACADTIDALWQFRLVFDPDPKYIDALFNYFVIRVARSEPLKNWLAQVEEVFASVGWRPGGDRN